MDTIEDLLITRAIYNDNPALAKAIDTINNRHYIIDMFLILTLSSLNMLEEFDADHELMRKNVKHDLYESHIKCIRKAEAPFFVNHRIDGYDISDDVADYVKEIKKRIDKHPLCLDFINSNGDTALIKVAKVNFKEAAEMLIEKGADPTIKDADGKMAHELALDLELKDILENWYMQYVNDKTTTERFVEKEREDWAAFENLCAQTLALQERK